MLITSRRNKRTINKQQRKITQILKYCLNVQFYVTVKALRNEK